MIITSPLFWLSLFTQKENWRELRQAYLSIQEHDLKDGRALLESVLDIY